MNFYRAFSLLLYKRKKVMIKNILTNLKIEQLNAMQEAAIDTWKEGKRPDFIVTYRLRQDFGLSVAFCYRV